jgi:hypothetical protein
MITVVKVNNGDEFIGTLKEVDGYMIINKPMHIVKISDGAMHLRDTLMLSDDTDILLPSASVLTTYTPIDELKEYYTKAYYYAKTYTKQLVVSQIQMSISDMEQMIREDEKHYKNLATKTGNTIQ